MSGPKPQKPTVHLAWAARAHGPSDGATPAAREHDAEQALRAVLQPLPHLPAEDLADLDLEQRLRMAVALDVICSASRKIAPGPTMLVQVTRAWLSLRGRSQSSDVLEGLVELAKSPKAVARARISHGLTRAASGLGSLDAAKAKPTEALGPLTTPHSVAVANRHVEAAGAAVVGESILWLSSQERTEFRRG